MTTPEPGASVPKTWTGYGVLTGLSTPAKMWICHRCGAALSASAEGDKVGATSCQCWHEVRRDVASYTTPDLSVRAILDEALDLLDRVLESLFNGGERSSPELVAWLDQVTTAPVGTNQYTEGSDIVTTLDDRGNSNTYALRITAPDFHGNQYTRGPEVRLPQDQRSPQTRAQVASTERHGERTDLHPTHFHQTSDASAMDRQVIGQLAKLGVDENTVWRALKSQEGNETVHTALNFSSENETDPEPITNARGQKKVRPAPGSEPHAYGATCENVRFSDQTSMTAPAGVAGMMLHARSIKTKYAVANGGGNHGKSTGAMDRLVPANLSVAPGASREAGPAAARHEAEEKASAPVQRRGRRRAVGRAVWRVVRNRMEDMLQ